MRHVSLAHLARCLVVVAIVLASPIAAAAAEKVQLLLPVRGSAAYAPYLAKQLGYFQEEGLDVEVVPGKGSTYVVQQISAGTVPIGMGVPGTILPAVARGQKLKFVYTYAVKNLFDLVVPEDSPIKTVADLRGKTVGITDLGSGEVPLVRALLAAANLRPGENVTMTVIGEKAPTILASFKDGRVQAFGGAKNDLVWLYQAGFKARSLSGEYHDLPSGGVFVTEKTFLERRDMVVKVSRSIARATLFALTNFDAAVGIMAKLAPEQFENLESGRVFLRTYLDLSTPSQKDAAGELVFGVAMPEGWERLQKIFLSGEKPVLAKPVDLAPVVTGDLVAEINRFDREKVRQQARTHRP
jgi:NitT/TauT family transport system substrate-binding protein